MTQSDPLVSIVVATFNSSSTIIETLDSIAAQTYRNIELIVTDDCSKDNTVEKVQKWDIQNRNIFVDCKIITHPINTGVSPNFNRGVLASSGIWVKTIAGDDTFRPDAIQKYVEYVLSHNSIMCVCDLNLFSEVDVPQRLRNFYKSYIEMIDVPQEEQYRDVLSYQHFAGPGYFYLRKVYDEIGGFDERYFMHFEDIDITRRIGNISRTVYFPNATIIHAHEAAHKTSKKMLLIGLKSAVKYFNKWGWIFDKERSKRNKKALKLLSYLTKFGVKHNIESTPFFTIVIRKKLAPF